MTRDRLTVGVLTPHAAAGPELELPAMTHGRVAAVVSRTGSPPPAWPAPPQTAPPAHVTLRASTEPAAVDRAAADFTGKSIAAVAHASTTTGYVLGHREEAALAERLSQRFDLPAVASCATVAAALRAHEVTYVQLVHSPWFDHEFDELGGAYFRQQGFAAMVTKAVGIPHDPARVGPHHVIDWVAHHVEKQTEAVFLAGTGFHAAAAIEELELRMGRLIVEANQALLWGILAATGAAGNIPGPGRLLRAGTSTP